MKAKKKSQGIRSIADVRDRCVIDDITGCWRMPGQDKNRRASPNIKYQGEQMTVGAMLYLVNNCERIPKGFSYTTMLTCKNKWCCNPMHRVLVTNSQLGALVLKPGTAGVAKRVATARKNSRFPESVISQIVNSELSHRATAEKYGCSRSYVHKLRAGISRAETIAGASVFAWRPAA